MKPGFVEMKDVRLKYRTYECDGETYAVAIVWAGPDRQVELSRLNLRFVPGPGSPAYQKWMDGVSEVFRTWITKITGVEAATVRRKADYRGEDFPDNVPPSHNP